MDDFFDLDQNGKLDAFESAMKYDMIEHMMSDEPSSEETSYKSSRYQHSSNKEWWKGFLKCVAITIGIWVVVILFSHLFL